MRVLLGRAGLLKWKENDAHSLAMDDASNPVFQQDWFLRSALPKAGLNRIGVFESGKELGYLPFGVVRNRLGLSWGGMTHWAHLTGPVLRDDLDEHEAKRVCLQLINKLPRGMRLYFVCQPPESIASVVRESFLECGFTHSQQITYSFPPDDPGVLSRFNKKHRAHIRSAERRLLIKDLGAKEFIEFYAQNLNAQGAKSYAPLEVAESIINAGMSLSPPQVRVTAAWSVDDASETASTAAQIPDAAIACIWDRSHYYFWMASRRHAFEDQAGKPHPDAMKLLIIRAAEDAKRLGLTFDLDGTSSAGTETLYKTVLKAPCESYRDIFRRPRIARRLGSRVISKAAAIVGMLT